MITTDMTTQIHRSDHPDYMTYLDALCEPIGGVDSHGRREGGFDVLI